MEDKNTDKLYIPSNIRKRKEYIDGIGNKEIFQIIVGLVLGLAIGLILFLQYKNFIVLFVPGVVLGTLVFFFVRKDSTGRNTIDRIMNWYDYLKEQKRYYYKYTNIYEKDVNNNGRKEK